MGQTSIRLKRKFSLLSLIPSNSDSDIDYLLMELIYLTMIFQNLIEIGKNKQKQYLM